jgi:hypothetical protein
MEIDPSLAVAVTSFLLVGVLNLSLMFFSSLFAKLTAFFVDWIAGELQ